VNWKEAVSRANPGGGVGTARGHRIGRRSYAFLAAPRTISSRAMRGQMLPWI